MRWPRAFLLLLILGGMAAAPRLTAQSGYRITRWRAADDLPQSSVTGLSVDPRGRIISSHDLPHPIAILDGYQITTISNSAGVASRAYLSRSEQLWSVDSTGLLEQTGAGWNRHPIPEIAAEYQARPARALRPPPLLPLDRNRTLILLPDRLLEFDAGERRAQVIRRAAETGLGRFHELSPALDEGAWISGERGLLHVPGPLRQVQPGTPFEEHLLPETLGVVDLQRPFENRAGEIVTVGEEPVSRAKAIVRYAAGHWTRWLVPESNLRQAWSGPDGDLWGHTSGTVFRMRQGPGGLRAEPVVQATRIADLALDPVGVAWLGTSEGLFRIAPMPWRPVPGFDSDLDPAFALGAGSRGQPVVLTARAVHWLEGTTWKSAPVPVDPRDDPRDDAKAPGQNLSVLPDGGLLVWTGSTLARFGADGERRKVPDGWLTARPLGTLLDGRVLLQRDLSAPDRYGVYDGELVRALELPPPAEMEAALGSPAFALQTRSGELWIGGETGLLVRRGDLWSPAEEAGDGALTGFELPDGRVLIGGRNGLREFDGKRWTLLRRGTDRIHAVHLDRDRTLWVASGTGLHRFRDNAWLVFSEEEGLPVGAAYTVFEDGAGRLRAGTARGLFEWDARADTDPPVAEIASADVPEEAGDTRALFVVGGTDRWRFTAPGRLAFSWRLDTEPWSTWRPAGSAQFTNLTAGTHRFFVRALDPSGNVQERETQVEFAVALPWFRDPRLVAASVAVSVLLVALAAQAFLSYWRLRRSYAEVERLVAVRTEALEKANAELLLSQKMRALGTLAAGVAHDFNNLLSIIRGSAQLLEGTTQDPEKTRQRVHRIKTAVDQGAALVRAMLGYSRGGTAPRRELDPAEVVRKTLRLLDERLQNRVRVHPHATRLPVIVAPPEMLQQILLNLIQNADDAMDHEGVVLLELEVSPAPAHPILKPPDAASYVAFRVRDQGTGIPAENLPRIFEPFFTTKGFSSRRGTGLGLSMVYEFSKDLGAGITVDSEVGKGSTFTILLPVATPGAAVDPASTKPGNPQDRESPRRPA